MGYHTDFSGNFLLNKPLDDETFTFLTKFSNTLRTKRSFPNNKYGIDGEFFVDGIGYMGQDNDESVINGNQPPSTQPSLWCQWIPTQDRMGIEWDGGEKFYEYIDWIKYLINNFLAPKGYVLNGSVMWNGEDAGDVGTIAITENIVEILYGRIVFESREPRVYVPEPVAAPVMAVSKTEPLHHTRRLNLGDK